MALSWSYGAFVGLLQLVRLAWGEQEDLAIEGVMFRHEVSVLRRQAGRRALRPPDRAVLAGLSQVPLSVRRARSFSPRPSFVGIEILSADNGPTRSDAWGGRRCQQALCTSSFD